MTTPTPGPGPGLNSAALEARIESLDALGTAEAIDEMSELTAALAAGLDPGRPRT